MRNVEIKAKVTNLKQLLDLAEKLAKNKATIINQQDTFYNVVKGRLKLRRFLNDDNGELIFYDRPDTEGPKVSLFEKVTIDSQSLTGLNEVLSKALGAKNTIKKTRHLFLVGQTRVHIDQVDNLGDFMELEVCLRPEQSPEEGEQIAKSLMEKLGIQEKDLISGAYKNCPNRVMCCAPDCKQNICKFFVLPADEKKKRWISLIRRGDRKPSKYSLVCCQHGSEN